MFVDCSCIVGDGVLIDYVHGWRGRRDSSRVYVCVCMEVDGVLRVQAWLRWCSDKSGCMVVCVLPECMHGSG